MRLYIYISQLFKLTAMSEVHEGRFSIASAVPPPPLSILAPSSDPTSSGTNYCHLLAQCSPLFPNREGTHTEIGPTHSTPYIVYLPPFRPSRTSPANDIQAVLPMISDQTRTVSGKADRKRRKSHLISQMSSLDVLILRSLPPTCSSSTSGGLSILA